ncbi:MAG: N-acetylmuramic acid 6-phosphate etherase [Bacilli bacterium]|nr:N-acetylmuramic acid 6-phosphate etherase [Bacilli bacterium]
MSNKINMKSISTEARLKESEHIDTLNTIEILNIINNQDALVHLAVKKALPQIEKVVDAAVESIKQGGRIIYIGAGTSGRMGLMDAVECPPTFSVSSDLVVGLLAGGMGAFSKAVEGAEDNSQLGEDDVKALNINESDILIGIAASGRTPYVIGAIKYAKTVGAKTSCIVTSSNSTLASIVDYPIEAVTGSEVITGSTRMKSGTAQKMICNMISSATMIRLGKVYQNYMIDVCPTNEKLVERTLKIISDACSIERSESLSLYEKYNSPKKAIFAYFTKIEDSDEIDELLNKYNGHLTNALKGELK